MGSFEKKIVVFSVVIVVSYLKNATSLESLYSSWENINKEKSATKIAK